jgi:hypothetical protein
MMKRFLSVLLAVLLVISPVAWAQSGFFGAGAGGFVGGGFYSPFQPTNIANLGLWLKPDAGITLDTTTGTTTVSRWANQASTGSGYDALQTTKNLQPAFGTGTLNGFSGIRFAATKRMSFGGGGLALGQNKPGISIFAVIKSNTSVSQNIIDFSQGNAGSDSGRFGLGITAGNALQFYGSRTDSVSFPAGVSGGTHTANAELVSSTWDLSTQTVFVYLNSSQVATSTTYSTAGSTIANTAASSAEVGDYIFYFSDPLAGDLYEVLIYERALTTTERQQVENYLKTRYAL